MIIKYLSLLTSCIFLAACGGLSVKPGSIPSVSVNPNIQVTTKPQLLSGIGILLNPHAESEKKKHRQYKNQLKRGGIDVGAIVLKEFKSAVSRHTVFGKKLTEHGAYVFRVSVPYHSLFQENTLSDRYTANVALVVELVGPEGEVLFKQKAQSCLFTKCVTPYTLTQIRSNPSLLVQQYHEASRDAVAEIMETL